MKQKETYVGIDVAKARVDVAIRPDGDVWSVDYDESGVRELVSVLETLEPAAVLLEATGGLEVPLVSALAAAALPVVVVNPRQVPDFARATGKLAKTDALDGPSACPLRRGGASARAPIAGCGHSGTQLPDDTAQPADDHAGYGEKSLETSFPLRTSRHPVPYHVAGAGVERPGQRPAHDLASQSGMA